MPRRKTRKKKGSTMLLKYLVGFTVTALAFFFVFSIISSYFRLTSQAEDSFTDFKDRIYQFEEEAKVGNINSYILTLDDETGITIFNKEADLLSVTEMGTITDTIYAFVKPDICKDNSCLCLCKEYADENVCEDDKYRCIPIPFHLQGFCKEMKCEGGLWLERGVTSLKHPRKRTVFMEMKQIDNETVVGVCDKAPCFE